MCSSDLGKYDLLNTLPVYKVRPAKNKTPFRWETGTPSFETIAGVGGCIAYLTEIGRAQLAAHTGQFPGFSGRRLELKAAMAALRVYERELVEHLIATLTALPGVQIFGITDPARYDERVPTVVFTKAGYTPQQIAAHLAEHHVYVWDGNYYAVEIMNRLGHGANGMVRVGLAHYNTHEEIDRLQAALELLA